MHDPAPDAAGMVREDYRLWNEFEDTGRTNFRYTVVDADYWNPPSSCAGTSVPGSWTSGIDAEGRALIREAADAWEAACGITFTEVAWNREIPLTDIEFVIAMDRIDGTGDTGGHTVRTRAVADYCGRRWALEGDETIVLLDSGDYRREFGSGTSGRPTQTEANGFYNIALHEIGHAIGIGHSDVAGAVMSGGEGDEPGGTPYTNWHGERATLRQDDVDAARALYGPPQSVLLVGGDTGDTLAGAWGDDTLLGRGGDDSLSGGAGNDRMFGGTGDDTLDGGLGDDYVRGEEGDDRVLAGAGDDTVLTGAGDDSIDGGDGFDRIFAGPGNDVILGGEGRGFLAGGEGADTITGGSGVDVVIAGGGDDRIAGQGGDDRLIGGAGNDTLEGGPGRNYLNGGEGHDSITGGAERDYLDGEGGDDTLIGGGARDVLAGGPGDDRLIGGAEGDTFFGQGGTDTFVVTGGRNWIMDFDTDDRLDAGMTFGRFQAAATQVGTDLRIALADGELYLAGTTLADVGHDQLIA